VEYPEGTEEGRNGQRKEGRKKGREECNYPFKGGMYLSVQRKEGRNVPVRSSEELRNVLVPSSY
jgi:hypothetical protein